MSSEPCMACGVPATKYIVGRGDEGLAIAMTCDKHEYMATSLFTDVMEMKVSTEDIGNEMSSTNDTKTEPDTEPQPEEEEEEMVSVTFELPAARMESCQQLIDLLNSMERGDDPEYAEMPEVIDMQHLVMEGLTMLMRSAAELIDEHQHVRNLATINEFMKKGRAGNA